MNKICKAFVKKKIFQKKRQYEKTYSRVRRGSGFVKFGNPIEPGRKIKEDKMDINVAFYIDKSGSMYNSIDNVFEAVFYIADALKKYFGKEKEEKASWYHADRHYHCGAYSYNAASWTWTRRWKRRRLRGRQGRKCFLQ